MDNERLIEIRNNLHTLPVLEERLAKLKCEIGNAKESVQSLLEKYKEESIDVEKLQNDSLSVTILKFIGRYEGKLTKENEQMYNAKLKYDKAAARVDDLNNELTDLNKRITELKQEKQTYEEELSRREEALKNNQNSEASAKYLKLVTKQDYLSRQLIEIDQAVSAAKRVVNTAESAIEHLDSAEGWATFDVWTRGGIFSHMAKYDHIDEAQDACNRLNSQMQSLRKELADVNLTANINIEGIDSTTRVIDFWFDNIFTDLNVRGRIRDDNERMRTLQSKIQDIVIKLQDKKSTAYNQINEIEQQKNDLIIQG